MKTLSVALFAAVTALMLAVAIAPAIAGGIVLDLPNLTFQSDATTPPVSATVDTNQSCLNPTSVVPACPDQK